MRCHYFASAWLLLPTLAVGQTVQPTGAPTTPVNWQSPASGGASFSDAYGLDLNGDGTADLGFTNVYTAPAGPGSPTMRTFVVGARHAAVELATDSVEFDSAKRLQAGQLIRHGIRWGNTGYIDYELVGNGGVGGRGFFRDGAPGFVVARMAVAGRWQYWWIQVESRSGGNRRVNYYGVSPERPLRVASPVGRVALQAYPNPATTAWQVQTSYQGPYRLLDQVGRVVRRGQLGPGEAQLPAAELPAGLYRLELSNALNARLTLVKQQ
ncbi:hypothetical protein [Hymenobacter edaphi]|uniref:Secretion system C-terminal sorting domain-containing protein n=1 Tax=Hymenobacter edaphi TaxID=2211146 RepID=A0A328BJX3_9BACT|nr:hypothetical protein [Hymenobacter edaphi]RAK66701.1 hypothetical protein DLM85_10800 [Hymenobacter edaphi]